VTLHATQVPLDCVVPVGHTQTLPTILNVLSGHEQLLLVLFRTKVGKHVPQFTVLVQIKQFVTLHKGIQTALVALS